MHQPPSKKRYVTLTLAQLAALKLELCSDVFFVDEYLIDMRASSTAMAPEPIWMLKPYIDQRRDPEVTRQLPNAKKRVRFITQFRVKLSTGEVCRAIPVIDAAIIPQVYESMSNMAVPNMPSFTFDKVHIIATRLVCGAIVNCLSDITPADAKGKYGVPQIQEGYDFDQELPLRIGALLQTYTENDSE